MDPKRALKTLIKQEMDRPKPNFGLVQMYLNALREVVGTESLRLEDNDCSDDAAIYVTGNNIVTTRDGFVAQSKGRRRESEADNALAAMGQLASRPAYDPLASVVQTIPMLEALYDDPAKREQVKAAVRAEIDNRLTRPAGDAS